MSIIYLLCVVLIGLWIWSLIRSFHYHKIWHFIIQLLLGIFILIPILSFIMKKSVNKKQNVYRQYIPPYTQQKKKDNTELHTHNKKDNTELHTHLHTYNKKFINVKDDFIFVYWKRE